jgi:hypothetical protein
MSETDRRETLARLYEELGQIEPTDERGRQVLATAREDIRRALEQSDEDTIADEPLVERLQDTIYHFEGTHPDLTAAINTVINSLSNMGL